VGWRKDGGLGVGVYILALASMFVFSVLMSIRCIHVSYFILKLSI
jgi:hypothetical protein